MCSWAILSCSSVREIALQKSKVSLCIATGTTLFSCKAESPESIVDDVEAAELACVEETTAVEAGAAPAERLAQAAELSCVEETTRSGGGSSPSNLNNKFTTAG
jgi:hypothetical protein